MSTRIKYIVILWMLCGLPLQVAAQVRDSITVPVTVKGMQEWVHPIIPTKINRDTSGTKSDSVETARLLKEYVAKTFSSHPVRNYLTTAGKKIVQQQKTEALNSYHALLNKAMPGEDIAAIKNWKSYIERLSPKSLISRASPDIQGKAFSHTGIKLDDQGQLIPAYFGNTYNVLNSLALSDQVTIKNIPVAVSFTRQDMNGKPFVSRNIFSSSFNKDAFLQHLRQQLKQTIQPSDIFPDDRILSLMHAGVENLLQRQIDSIIGTAKLSATGYLRQFTHPQDLLDKDASTLSRQIFSSDYVAYIKGRENILQELKQKANSGQWVNKQQMDSLSNQVAAFKKLQAIYQKIISVKEKWGNDKLVQQLKQLQLQKKQKFEALLNNPATLKQLAEKYLPLNGTEKLFLDINSLNLGQHTTNLSPLSLQDFISTGVNLEMEKKNKYLMLIAGKEKDLNALYDVGNFQSLLSNEHRVMGISLGTGDPAANHTHITLMSYSQGQAGSYNTSNLVPKNKVVVAGIDNQFNIADNTIISTELSRSSMHYDQASGVDEGHASVLNKLTGINKAAGNMAAMIRMQGNYQKIGMNAQASLSFIAGGYDNPGNLYLPRGTKEVSFSSQKYFLKRRLTLDARGDIRRYNLGVNREDQMQNNFFSLEGRWNAPNGEFVSLSYQPARNMQILRGKKNINGITDLLQVTGCVQQRIWGTFYRNIFSLGYSKNQYDWDSSGKVNSRSMIYSAMQSIVLHNNLLYLDMTYNHANNINNVVYFNTTFTSQLGYTYRIGKKINASSGIEYDAVQQWYNEAGIMQSVSLDVTSRLQLSWFVDLKKNIKLYHTAYYNDLYQADWSLHYSF